jgi:hypothetical protein
MKDLIIFGMAPFAHLTVHTTNKFISVEHYITLIMLVSP